MALGDSLAAYMLPALEETGWRADLVLPVPLSKPRRRERGYNQAGLIARPLALALGLPYVPKALARCRDTRSQVGLSREQRRQNVNGVFQAGSEQVRDRRVLLIDDVATTGSTLSAAAGALLASGASQVYAFTAARAAWTASVTHPGAP
jgi:ComF family protein